MSENEHLQMWPPQDFPIGNDAQRKNTSYLLSSKFAIELDEYSVEGTTIVPRIPLCAVSSCKGGNPVGVSFEDVDVYAGRVVSGVVYEPFTIRCGTNMTTTFYDWVKACMQGRDDRDETISSSLLPPSMYRDGACVVLDGSNKIACKTQFKDCVITSVTFPSCDPAGRESSSLSLTLEPSVTRYVSSPWDLTKSNSPTTLIPLTSKPWLPANFRLRINGLEASSSKVSKIESFYVKSPRDTASGVTTGKRMYCPRLVFYCPEKEAVDFYEWYVQTLREPTWETGTPNPNFKNGTIDYLESNKKDVLFTVSFTDLNICVFEGLSNATTTASGQRICKIECFVAGGCAITKSPVKAS